MAPILGQGVEYCRQAREIIMNVWAYFTTLKFESEPAAVPGLRPAGLARRTAVQHTLMATGMKSRATLYKIKREGAASPQKRGPKTKRIMDLNDEFTRGAIRRIISGMYERKEWPTVASIHDKVKAEVGFIGSQSTLKNLLTKMGYKYGKRPTRNLVKERPDIVAKRHDYLLKMQKIRQLTNCPIVYLDETFLNQNHTVSKCWLRDGEGGFKVPTGKGNRLIILHAGSREGFIANASLIFQSKTSSGDYHDEMNGDVFVQWFVQQLLPNIPPRSCIVMDNASYHSMQENKVPTMSSRKDEMKEWLTSNGIAWNTAMIKPQLYELIQMNKPRCTKHVIDELARQHEHYILRLPPYHCELNAIELIWAQVKGEVATQNDTFKMCDIKILLANALANVTPENWEAADQHVMKLETQIFESEIRIDTTLSEEMLNTFRFHLADNDDDESSDSESETDEAGYSSAPECPIMTRPRPATMSTMCTMSNIGNNEERDFFNAMAKQTKQSPWSVLGSEL